MLTLSNPHTTTHLGAEPQPFLSGPTFGSEGGDWLSSLLDVWLFFPRAGLLKLLPAMSGVQRLQYGYAGGFMGWVYGW